MAYGSVNAPGAGYLDFSARLANLERTLNGLEKLTGPADPTAATSAQVGQLYVNIITGREWKCIAVSESGTVWEPFEGGGTLGDMAELFARLASLERALNGLEKLAGPADPTAATSAQVGQIYVNITTGEEWVCTAVSDSGTTWVKRAARLLQLFVTGASVPERTDVLWIDTTPVTGGLKYHNGSAWAHVPTATV